MDEFINETLTGIFCPLKVLRFHLMASDDEPSTEKQLRNFETRGWPNLEIEPEASCNGALR